MKRVIVHDRWSMAEDVNIEHVELAPDEVWDLKISLYNNYWRIVNNSKRHKKDSDAKVVSQLAGDLLDESMKDITTEVNNVGD